MPRTMFNYAGHGGPAWYCVGLGTKLGCPDRAAITYRTAILYTIEINTAVRCSSLVSIVLNNRCHGAERPTTTLLQSKIYRCRPRQPAL
jgi:hypothetical protein